MDDRTLTNMQYCIARAIQATPEEFRPNLPPARPTPMHKFRQAPRLAMQCPICTLILSANETETLSRKINDHLEEHRLIRSAARIAADLGSSHGKV